MSSYLKYLNSDDDDETTEIDKIDTEIDAEVNKLLTEYDSNKTDIIGNRCPIFFSQLKNKFFTFSNKGKVKVRQYLVNKITLEKQKLGENDPRIPKLQYFLDKLCECTGACKDTINEKIFIKGGKKIRKTRRRYVKKTKNIKKRKTRKTKRRI